MPKEIDCSDCGGSGEYYQFSPDCNQCPTIDLCEKPHREFCTVPSKCDNCKDGKITVYTQSDVDSLVEAEREAIIVLFNIYMESDNMTANLLIKLIRARSK